MVQGRVMAREPRLTCLLHPVSPTPKKTRVTQALTSLVAQITGLSAEPVVAVEKYAKIYRVSSRSTQKRVRDVDNADDLATSAAQKKYKVDAPPITGYEANVEQFAEADNESDAETP